MQGLKLFKFLVKFHQVQYLKIIDGGLMKKVLIASLMLFVTFIVADAFANNVGCGFGTEILKGKKGKVFEVLAVTTNGTSGSSTFAITTGTSGYKEGAMIGVNIVDVYISENMDNLASDIAKGDGEYLDTLAHLMKVEDKQEFKNKLHQNFNKIYNSKDIQSKEVVANINSIHNS